MNEVPGKLVRTVAAVGEAKSGLIRWLSFDIVCKRNLEKYHGTV